LCLYLRLKNKENAVAISSPSLLSIWLADGAGKAPAEGSFSLDLAVWRWVVIIGVGAVVVIWLVRRVSEVVVARKTRNIIEQVVGRDAGEAGGADRGWDDVADLDQPGETPDPKP
jgi:hypothetical protein